MSDPRRQLFAVACAGMVVFGMILALPGTVLGLPAFAAQFHLTLSGRGIFIAALFGGLLIGSLLSGMLVDRGGYRRSIAGSAGAIAVLFPLFGLASSYELAVAALLGLGLSSATLNTAANTLSSDLFPEERGRRMTMLAMAFSVGGLLLPTVTAAAADVVSWRAVVLGGATLSGLIAAVTIGVSAPARSADAGAIVAKIAALRQQPEFTSFCLLLACGAANEGVFAGWTSTYLDASGFSPVAATWGLSSHWLGLLIGRVLFARLVDRAKSIAIVRSALAGGAILLAMIAVPVTAVLALGPLAAGVAIGVIVPTSLALAGERLPDNPAALFGLLLTMAQVGGMLLPPVIGAVADLTSLRAALLLAVTNAAVIATLAWRVR